MPSSFVVDKKGIVRFVNEGFDGAGDVAKFRQELDELSR
jgi:peroxiredoxin